MSITVQKVISKSLEKPNPVFTGNTSTGNQLSLFYFAVFENPNTPETKIITVLVRFVPVNLKA
jgi:hypothetical protein